MRKVEKSDKQSNQATYDLYHPNLAILSFGITFLVKTKKKAIRNKSGWLNKLI